MYKMQILRKLLFLNSLLLSQAENILDFLQSRDDLQQFLLVLQRPGLHKAYLERQITVFVPTDKALLDYRGVRGEDFALNHIVNSVELESKLGTRLSTLVTGGPPIWVTRRSAWIYFNQARVLEKNIVLNLGRTEQQIVYILDGVLEPLLPISVKNATFTQDVTAGKLLQLSTLYNIGDNLATRIFYQSAVLNKRERMFDVPGRHTFFLPIDQSFQVVAREFVDAKVVEAHIVPGQLLLTTLIPTQEYATVAYDRQLPGVRVNVSLQPSLADGGKIMVRSNTIEGDRVHSVGLVVSRIVKGNIPVQNGIVHLIDKPLMVVARSLFDYVMEEGSDPNNRLYRFAQLIKDKGGLFGETILESKDGTLLAPSNEAFRNVDMSKMNYILAHQALREEFFGLHFTRERISSNEIKLQRSQDRMYSVPASWATNRLWFHYSKPLQSLTVEGRGVNASVLEKDIGTVNGVIHIIDRILGVPFQSVGDKMAADPGMSHSWSLAVATRLSSLLLRNSPGARITMMVPTNAAWEKVKRDFTQAFRSLTDINTPDFATRILQRHLIISDRDFTIEQLVERSLRNPTTTVPTEGGELTITGVGEFQFNAYKDWYVSWDKIKGKVVRPNIECINGYIHLVDTVMMDERQLFEFPMTSGSSRPVSLWPVFLLLFAFSMLFSHPNDLIQN